MLLHFVILYALSIVVRYLPALWHEIEDGALDHLRALIEHYLVIVDNVLPRLAIESIIGRRFIVVQPGSMQGRFRYCHVPLTDRGSGVAYRQFRRFL
jgi:hypothetical protein